MRHLALGMLLACGSAGERPTKPGSSADTAPDDSDAVGPRDTGTTPPEVCDDGVDNDVDGGLDCDDPDCSLVCDADQDGDRGLAFGGGDCDDADASVNSGALELCDDGIDQDCDGVDDCHPLLSGEIPASASEVYLYGAEARQHAGSPSAVADIDLDGQVELLVGSTADLLLPSTRTLQVWKGPWTPGAYDLAGSALTITGEDPDSSFGAMGMVPDLTGDGLEDLAVGDYAIGGNTGTTYILAGPLSGQGPIGDLAIATLEGTVGSYAGQFLAGQDRDGDGSGELWIAGPYAGNYIGSVWVTEGPLVADSALADSGSEIRGENQGLLWVFSMASSDFDGDGEPEMALGNALAGNSDGEVLVFAHTPVGVETAAQADLTIESISSNDQTGAQLVPTGDLTGDGLPDLLVTATNANNQQGGAWLVAGPLGPLTGAVVEVRGTTASFGHSATLAGDMDLDGAAEVLVTDRQSVGLDVACDGYLLDLSGAAGTVAPLDVAQFVVRDDGAEALGYGSSGAGDLDGDGFVDLALSASSSDGPNGTESGGLRLIFGAPEF